MYNYNGSVDTQSYVYSIDNEGNTVVNYSPSYSTSSQNFITTSAQKTWWTQMTQFPVKATLEIKGLLRPIMLMTNIRINAFFYGQRHVASGIYFVTQQVDRIGKNGYRTTLSLTRYAGDDDYVKTVTEERTYNYYEAVKKTVAVQNANTDNKLNINYHETEYNGTIVKSARDYTGLGENVIEKDMRAGVTKVISVAYYAGYGTTYYTITNKKFVKAAGVLGNNYSIKLPNKYKTLNDIEEKYTIQGTNRYAAFYPIDMDGNPQKYILVDEARNAPKDADGHYYVPTDSTGR